MIQNDHNELSDIERAGRMMQIALDAAIWADGRLSDPIALEKLVSDLLLLQEDAENIVLKIERLLPEVSPPA